MTEAIPHIFFEQYLSQLAENSFARNVLWQLMSCPKDRLTKELVGLASHHPEVTLSLLEKLVQEHPTSEYLEIYGHCLLKLQQIEQAKFVYQKVLDLDRTSLRVRFNLAQALQRLNDYENALVHLEYCLTENPAHPTFLFQAGACCLQMAKIEAAKDFFEKALRVEPRHIEALVNLGICFLREKNYAAATYHLGTACRMDETHLPAQFNLSVVLLENKRYVQAKNQLEHYIRRAPHDLEAKAHLGYCYTRLDETDAAEACFQEILNINPRNIYSLQNLAFIALKKNEPSVGLAYFQRVLKEDSTDEIALYMQAALSQSTLPASAPPVYVKNLFDAYAPQFEEHLKNTLNYQTPESLYQLWKKNTVQKQAWLPVHHILDLGCGTGLAGALFKPHAKRLVGVDLSQEMLDIAKQKNIYDALIQSELISYLSSDTQRYDLVILADVLVYLGDLTGLFEQLSEKTLSVALSVELTDTDDYVLCPTGRYQHHLHYILSLIDRYRFQEIATQEVILRQENHQPVKGAVILFSQKF